MVNNKQKQIVVKIAPDFPVLRMQRRVYSLSYYFVNSDNSVRNSENVFRSAQVNFLYFSMFHFKKFYIVNKGKF